MVKAGGVTTTEPFLTPEVLAWDPTGDEVRRTYGHADDRIALRRVANAYELVQLLHIRKDMA